jgi:hypothetical protein
VMKKVSMMPPNIPIKCWIIRIPLNPPGCERRSRERSKNYARPRCDILNPCLGRMEAGLNPVAGKPGADEVEITE